MGSLRKMFYCNPHILSTFKESRDNFKEEIILKVYTEKLCLRSNKRGLILKLIREYLPFFQITSHGKNKVFKLEIICGIKKIKHDFEKRKISNPWDYRYRAKAKNSFCFKGDNVFYFQQGIGFGSWNSKGGRLLLIKNKPALNGDLKYFFYTFLFDWLSRNGYFPLHGCSVALGDKGILILGQAAAGKSTLAIHLLRKNFNCLGDNTIFLKKEQNKFYLSPFLKYISLTASQARKYPECLRLMLRKRVYRRKPDKLSFRISDFDQGFDSRKAQLNLILFPNLRNPAGILTRKSAQSVVEKELRSSAQEMILGISNRGKSLQIKNLARNCAKTIPAYHIYTRHNLDLINQKIRNLLVE